MNTKISAKSTDPPVWHEGRSAFGMSTRSAFLSSLCLLLGTATVLSALPLVVTDATIIPVDDTGRYIASGYLVIGEDGRIAALGPGQPPEIWAEAETLSAKGKMVIPGFLSGHSHLFQSPFRGLGSHYTLHGWIVCYHRTYGPHYDETDLYWLSKHGAMDYLGHGITTIYDWTLNSGWSVDTYTDLYRGSLDSGARILFGYGADLSKDYETNHAMLTEYLELIAAEGIDASHPRVPGVWMSGLGLLNGRETASMEFDLARAFDLPMQVHYLEEPNPEYVAGQQALFPLYEEKEMLGPNFNFAHFINVTPEILAETAKSDTRMIWNPLSNGRLASGLADIPHYRELGIKVGMGIDGQASADISDPFENLRMGMYATRMKYQRGDSMMPMEVLRMHTLGTAEVFGIEDEVGSLEIGKWGDFLIIDPREMETSPPLHPVEHLVLSCSVANLEAVYVGGVRVVERGHFLHTDYTEVKDQITTRVARIQAAARVAREAGGAPPAAVFEGMAPQRFVPEEESPLYAQPGWGEDHSGHGHP